MNVFSISIKPQYVAQTEAEGEFFNAKKQVKERHRLHKVQQMMREEFDNFKEFTIITAPTGTGKSYAFPFPALTSKKKKKGFEGSIRGLIVLPTNALIEELTANFRSTFPGQLNIRQISGKVLTEMGKKGYSRWEAILEMCGGDTDLVITNPDIINYAMHGGYHKRTPDYLRRKTGRSEILNFLEKFGYIIFDEYHLYDESQVANILTLARLRDFFLQLNDPIKYIFASATPEKALKEILMERGLECSEIVEEIVDSPKDARAIHGRLEVEFHLEPKVEVLIEQKLGEIRTELEEGRKVLLILDKLRSVQQMAKRLEEVFEGYRVYMSSGYVADGEEQKKEIDRANIIVATNKAEVGVNYDVEYCVMQPGKFFQNFVQRFGRVSRNDLPGKIVVALDNSAYGKVKKGFRVGQEMDYYAFMEVMRGALQSKLFYSEMVPFFEGEYMWCIQHTIRKHQAYNSWGLLQKQLKASGFFEEGRQRVRYFLFQDIQRIIDEMVKKYPKGPTARAWQQWWQRYLDTYLSFRDASLVVEIVDRKYGIELKYSLEWILQHRRILDMETIDKGKYQIKRYTVGDFKDRNKDLQYYVSTIPSVGAKENELPKFENVVNKRMLKLFFGESVERVRKRGKGGLDLIDEWQMELIPKLEELQETFHRKRLKIEDIKNDDPFL